VLVGINVAPADFDDITALAQGGAALAQDSSALAPGGVTVERARNDFPVLLRNCDLSLSQGGYNTVMEVLEGSARAVIVPYAGGIETEQTLRARVLAERGGIHVLDEARCSPERLAAAAAAALAAPPPHPFGLDTGGAGTTARLVCELAGSVV
jgi:predicted glycosyltransferase